MIAINNYLFFNGNCKEAIDFYMKALNGNMLEMQTFGESPMEAPPEIRDNIMHATMEAAGTHIMFSDGMGQPHHVGNNVQLAINCESVEEQSAIWEKLKVGGNVTMDLEDTFWGARFGQLTDKFGIHWMLNFDYPDKKK